MEWFRYRARVISNQYSRNAMLLILVAAFVTLAFGIRMLAKASPALDQVDLVIGICLTVISLFNVLMFTSVLVAKMPGPPK